MIQKLNPKHEMDVWMNQQLVKEIETAFKQTLKTNELMYYYIPCSSQKQEEKTLKKQVKWMGSISLIDFMKKVQKLNASFCPIGVTNTQNKKQLLHYLEHDFYSTDKNIPFWDYWIGDVVGQDMVCGDELVITLWNRVKEQKTKGSTTKKIRLTKKKCLGTSFIFSYLLCNSWYNKRKRMDDNECKKCFTCLRKRRKNASK